MNWWEVAIRVEGAVILLIGAYAFIVVLMRQWSAHRAHRRSMAMDVEYWGHWHWDQGHRMTLGDPPQCLTCRERFGGGDIVERAPA
jgi:hypothetical protein